MAKFGRVNHYSDRWAIIGTGPSVEGVDLSPLRDHDITVVAVNGAIRFAAPDLWFTLDPSEVNLHIMRSAVPGVHYYAALAERRGRPHSRLVAHDVPEGRITYLRRVNGTGPINSQEGLAVDPGHISSGNSAYGALNLAWHGIMPGLGPSRAILLGVDGGGQYAHGLRGRTGPMDHVPNLFRSALPQLHERRLEVWNGSPDSTVDCFPRVAPQLAIAWVCE